MGKSMSGPVSWKEFNYRERQHLEFRPKPTWNANAQVQTQVHVESGHDRPARAAIFNRRPDAEPGLLTLVYKAARLLRNPK